MTVDIATLAIRIDSMEARVAARDLDNFRQSGDRAQRSASALEEVARKVNAALAFVGVSVGAASIIKMIDEHAKLTAQLRLATQSQREFGAAYDAVRRIANSAQQDLAATGVLYARITNGTRELGTSQRQVAAITETVSLAMKVSGATAAESASAQLQLAQAFATGALRGDEFNSVNESAPRLMKALADGMGVVPGALRAMAEQGKITSQVMADVLPKALVKLQEEAQRVQTIGGAFVVLKNKVTDFIGTQAQANGAVALLTGGIGLLSNNLGLLIGTMATLASVKIATWLQGAATSAMASASANSTLRATTLASAQANAVATASANALAIARVAELRAAVLAAEGSVALAITTNGLIPAQARAAAAAQAHTAALAAQTAAQSAASVSARAMGGVLGFLGGPLGAAITLLGLGATAWMVWGNKATFKNVFFDWLYSMTLKKWIVNLQGSVSSGGVGGISSLFGGGESGGLGGVASLLETGKNIYSAIGTGFTGLMSSLGSGIASLGTTLGSATMQGFGMGLGSSGMSAQGAGYLAQNVSGFSAGAGAASYIPIAGWIATGMLTAKNLFNKGWDPNNGSVSKQAWTLPLSGESLLLNKVLTTLGMNDKTASILTGASLVSKVFGRKNPEIESQGIQGTVT